MVDGFPQGLLARGSLPGRWGIGPEGFDVLLTLGHGRFQGGQTLELQSAEAVRYLFAIRVWLFGDASFNSTILS